MKWGLCWGEGGGKWKPEPLVIDDAEDGERNLRVAEWVSSDIGDENVDCIDCLFSFPPWALVGGGGKDICRGGGNNLGCKCFA